MSKLISKFGERRKRIVMLSQAVAPFGTPTSFANHSVSWMHISNYISPRMARLKYNEALPFAFFSFFQTAERIGGKWIQFLFQKCAEDRQSPQINRLVTAWQIGCWPFTDSDLIVSWIRVIISGLHWNWQLFSDKFNTLVRQRQIVLFRAGSHSIDVVPERLFIAGTIVIRTPLFIPSSW